MPSLRALLTSVLLMTAAVRTSEAKEPGLTSRTLGGVQFWDDQLVFRDWRIQKHVMTGHCRLLDGLNQRHVSGSYESCEERLGEIRKQRNLEPYGGPVVIVVHGLGGWRGQMEGLSNYLRDEGELTVYTVGYASKYGSIARHAESLAKVVESLGTVPKIHFVAYSMGNIVLRHYLQDERKRNQGQLKLPLGKVVMLAPPNQGARLAQIAQRLVVGQVAIGRSGRELGYGWSELETHLTTPPCPFGIIAAGRANDSGYNPLLSGDDDLLVTLEETKLPGASDFVQVPSLHHFVPDHEQAREYTLRFLQQGYFRTPELAQPIARDPGTVIE